MILVLLGTQDNSFHRLLEEIDKLVQKKAIQETIVVQAGHTKYVSENMKIFDFINKEELENYQRKADIIITHGGVGSILQAILERKKVIAVPRLHKYGEHVNDHQKEIVELMSEKGYIIGLQGVHELEEALKKVGNFEPKKYKQDNNKMLKIIENFIDNC